MCVNVSSWMSVPEFVVQNELECNIMAIFCQLPAHAFEDGYVTSRLRRSGHAAEPADEELPALQLVRPGRKTRLQICFPWTR